MSKTAKNYAGFSLSHLSVGAIEKKERERERFLQFLKSLNLTFHKLRPKKILNHQVMALNLTCLKKIYIFLSIFVFISKTNI